MGEWVLTATPWCRMVGTQTKRAYSMAAQVTFAPTFTDRATTEERAQVDQLVTSVVQFAANDLGATSVYVNKQICNPGEEGRVTFAFNSKNSKYLRRFTLNTMAAY